MITMRHSLERTSPKGQKFVGVCVLCGTPGLTFEDMKNDECPNQRGLTEDEAVIEAITGVRNGGRGAGAGGARPMGGGT